MEHVIIQHTEIQCTKRDILIKLLSYFLNTNISHKLLIAKDHSYIYVVSEIRFFFFMFKSNVTSCLMVNEAQFPSKF